MKSPSHALIGLACGKMIGLDRKMTRYVIAGATAPDVPLALVWSWVAAGVTLRSGSINQTEIQQAFDPIYFGFGWTSALHNVLHSPLSLLGLLLLAQAARAFSPDLASRLWVFLMGAATHSLVDIATHIQDGPLVLWPINYSLRLEGFVSHWDPMHGGLWMTGLESGAGIFVAAYIILERRSWFTRIWHNCRVLAAKPLWSMPDAHSRSRRIRSGHA